MRIESGDLIVADRNGVVVIAFARIDAVIKAVNAVAELEGALEAKVKAGFCQMQRIEEMIAAGDAVVEE